MDQSQQRSSIQAHIEYPPIQVWSTYYRYVCRKLYSGITNASIKFPAAKVCLLGDLRYGVLAPIVAFFTTSSLAFAGRPCKSAS